MEKKDKKIVVYGIYPSTVAASQGLDALRQSGFSAEEVSALLPDGDQTRQFAFEKGTKAPEGAATGGVAGAVLGGAFGWLAGIGSLAIPGVGPLIAAGPIMAALAGTSVGTALGAVSGALVGMGMPEYEAKRYEGRVKEGGILLSVHCCSSERVERAEEALNRSGARDVSSASEAAADFVPDRNKTGYHATL